MVGCSLTKDDEYVPIAASEGARNAVAAPEEANLGWQPLPTYVWNEEQTEAVMTVEGATIDVRWVDAMGKQMDLAYSAPSQSLCKSCHVKNGKLTPIGPKA